LLELKDFYHLPQVEPLFEQLAADGPGLIVVAGLDPRPLAGGAAGDRFLPSGRSAIFRIVMRQILAARPRSQAIVVAESEEAVRLPRQVRRQVSLSLVDEVLPYAQRIASAARRRPDLVVIDRLCAENAPAAVEAVQRGVRVLAQLDTVYRGAEVARQLADLGVSREQIHTLRWVVAVQRLATLCPACKQPAPPGPAQIARLQRLYPNLDLGSVTAPATSLGIYVGEVGAAFFQAAGCEACGQTGREGEVAAFDIYRADRGAPDPFDQPSLLPLEAYLFGLAERGYLPLDDLLHLKTDQLRRTYGMLAPSEQALAKANAALEAKLAELEAAHRVLQQRTEALISLQGIGHALITSTSLDELAGRLCRHACDLCGAHRAILYLAHPAGQTAEILAAIGWDTAPIRQTLDAGQVFPAEVGGDLVPFTGWPPGVPLRLTDAPSRGLAGLRVPLVAQKVRVGQMIVHASDRLQFTPGAVALLQTFANHAALAIQRARLVEALRIKIDQLEAAQAELVTKERLERELELARQVQQSVLPRIFPLVPGYAFAAHNEPARRVGGDFYDVILLDADRFGVVIGDVSDKGMPAALYMALTRSLLLAESRREPSPRAVLANVHRLLLELGQPSMFVTVFYGVVDGAAQKLTYSRAGHERPVLLRNGRAQLLGGEGAFLGFVDDMDRTLTEERIELAPGDRLVLYTDGLTDAQSADGRAFGLERMVELLQAHAGLAPDELCAHLFAELAAYQGSAGQYDDMTMVVVQVNQAD
jgi:serine phosphatase RsbU (regulator of sigma subunit)